MQSKSAYYKNEPGFIYTDGLGNPIKHDGEDKTYFYMFERNRVKHTLGLAQHNITTNLVDIADLTDEPVYPKKAPMPAWRK